MPACHAGGHEFESRTHRKKSSSVNSGGLFLKPKIDTNIKRNMCGIVGYIGRKDAFPILIKGLRRLEYRVTFISRKEKLIISLNIVMIRTLVVL